MAAQRPRISEAVARTTVRGSRAPTLNVVPIDPERNAQPRDAWADALHALAEHGDRDAFARLFAHFAPRIKSFLMRGGSPEVQAEELAQEVLVVVWRKAAMFDASKAGASTWIFTIARNLRVDSLRRRAGRDEQDGQDAEVDFDLMGADEPGVEDRLHASRESERLRGALAQLPPEQQQVLRLAYFDDESHSRISTELGIPLGTVKSRVRLAVAQLRRLLEP
ncbi:MAG: sigma-70 family RNA polymerase sigma factor [Burkholderiaceae bacterium]|nr:sigma-70 family RNA polymerase sigma factor [Burkholderiaceae bacterium]